MKSYRRHALKHHILSPTGHPGSPRGTSGKA